LDILEDPKQLTENKRITAA